MPQKRERTSDAILEHARVVRNFVVGVHGRSTGHCYEASIVLGKRLESSGIETRFVEGFVILPEGHHACHYWLEREGLLINVTGDQFNGRIQGYHIPDILYTHYRNVKGIYGKRNDSELPPHAWHGAWASTICTCRGAL